jgi:lysophospholipase L1-like esterase
MKTLYGVYRAVCLSIDVNANVVSCQVPQVFAEETVTCLDVTGGLPEAGSIGWVAFESGFPDRPVWLAAGGDAIHVGPEAPGGSVELWYDTNATGSAGGGESSDTTGLWFYNRRWYALGTSLTEQNFYTAPLADISGMILNNVGASSGTLTSGGASGGNGYIWSKLMNNVGTDAEVITLETTNDWRLSVALGTIDDAENEALSFYGALKKACAYILSQRAAARFFLITNYPDAYPSVYANFKSKNSRNLWYYEYNDAVKRVGQMYGVPVIDAAMESGINYYTAGYYTSDGLHLNTLGGQRLAEYLWSRIRVLGWETTRPAVPTGETKVAVTGVSIVQGTSAMIIPPNTQQMSVNVTPFNATEKGVTWLSTDPTKATVSANGLVTAVAIGTTTIRATTIDGGFIANLALSVVSTIPVASVDLSPAAVSIGVTSTVQLTATVSPANASNKAVTYVSSDPSKVTVSSTGLVTGVALGSANITVTTTAGGFTDVTSVGVVPSEWSLAPQTSFRQIGVTGLTSTGSNPTYTNINLPYGAILLNTPGDNAVEFAISNGSKGGGFVLGSNGTTDFISIGNVSIPLSLFNAKAAFANGAYSAAEPPPVTPTAAVPNWGTGVIYRIGRLGNRVKIVRVDGGTLTTIWDGDLPTNFVGHDSKFTAINLGLLAYSTPESYYPLPINCKTGTWTPP